MGSMEQGNPKPPWEVIELIIDNAHNDLALLCSFSLTCKQLQPRSRSTMLNNCHLKTKEQVSTLKSVLQKNPDLAKTCEKVKSLSMCPINFQPSCIIDMFPNLSTLQLIPPHDKDKDYPKQHDPPALHFNRKHQGCHRRYLHTTTLSLHHISFQTASELLRLCFSFPNVRLLTCEDVKLKSSAEASKGTKDKLLKQKLETLQILGGVDQVAASLLLGCVQSTMQNLMWTGTLDDITISTLEEFEQSTSNLDSPTQKWGQLHTLTLNITIGSERAVIEELTDVLKRFNPPSLKDVTVHLIVTNHDMIRSRTQKDRIEWIDVCSKLETALIKYDRRHITSSSLLLRLRKRLWTHELGNLFPALRDSITVMSNAVGHESDVTALVPSLDSELTASGSKDFTVVVWDTIGASRYEWVAHYDAVLSLAFSPNTDLSTANSPNPTLNPPSPDQSPPKPTSWLLASTGADAQIIIWELDRTVRRVATLEGHTSSVNSCAWSPDGNKIVSGGDDKTVRIWDANTHQQLHLFDDAHRGPVVFVRLSPNGRWLASGDDDCYCCVWDVSESKGTLHKVFRGYKLRDAVFDPRSTRLANTSSDGTVQVWDVEKGKSILVFPCVTEGGHAEFSPDGRTLLIPSHKGITEIVDASNGSPMLSIADAGHVVAARFSPRRGEYIATASWDKRVRLWKASDGSCVHTYSEHRGEVWHAGFSPNGATLHTGGDDGAVFVRRLPEDPINRWQRTERAIDLLYIREP